MLKRNGANTGRKDERPFILNWSFSVAMSTLVCFLVQHHDARGGGKQRRKAKSQQEWDTGCRRRRGRWKG